MLKVVTIEFYDGKKYIFRLDKEYEKPLLKVLNEYFEMVEVGNVANISVRCIKEGIYNNITSFEDELKELNDDK